jgi:hypothetical protein
MELESVLNVIRIYCDAGIHFDAYMAPALHISRFVLVLVCGFGHCDIRYHFHLILYSVDVVALWVDLGQAPPASAEPIISQCGGLVLSTAGSIVAHNSLPQNARVWDSEGVTGSAPLLLLREGFAS